MSINLLTYDGTFHRRCFFTTIWRVYAFSIIRILGDQGKVFMLGRECLALRECQNFQYITHPSPLPKVEEERIVPLSRDVERIFFPLSFFKLNLFLLLLLFLLEVELIRHYLMGLYCLK